jgi:SAM-dependent methyltransferase
MDKADWEEHFRALAAAGSAQEIGQPEALVEEIASALPPARALDLACGAGANALWLAQRGWDVTAVDRSPSAIEIVRARAERLGVKIATRVDDLEARDFTIAPGAWDLILMCRYLQRDLFEPAKLGLRPCGLLIVIVLLAEPERSESGTQRFRVQPGEFGKYFSGRNGWTILHQREGTTRDHQVAEIAFRRDF